MMRMMIVAAVMGAVAGPSSADGDPRFADPAFVIAELEKLRDECSQMKEGEVRAEIFGIEIMRVGQRCILGPGDVDANLVRFFSTKEIAWAGLHGSDSLWVSISE